MGMLAFYSGLIIGTLVGVVLISLIAMWLKEQETPELPDRPDTYVRDQADLQRG